MATVAMATVAATVAPAAIVARGALAGRSFARRAVARAALFALRLLARELYAALLIDRDDLHRDLVADLDHVGNAADIALVQLADVAQAVLSLGDFDERAKILDARDAAFVDAADLHVFGDAGDQLLGPCGAFGAGAGDKHRAVVLDVDRRAGLSLQRLDRLAARSDQLADLLRVDLHGDQARRVFADRGARRGDGLLHLVQNLHAGLARELQRFAHDLARDAVRLDVELNAGDAVARAGHLEVHVAEVVFLAQNVDDQLVPAVLLDQTHRDSRDRGLDRNAGVHQGQRPAADRRHRARTVRFENVAHQADRVRKLLRRGQDRFEAALGQCAVADLAAAGRPDALHFADRERREVVVQQEFLAVFLEHVVDDLLVARRAERGRDHRLRLAAAEERGAVYARQPRDLARQRADFVQLAAVGADVVVENLGPDEFFLDLRDGILDLRGRVLGVVDALGAELGDDLLVDLLHRGVALQLALDALGGLERGIGFLAHAFEQPVIRGGRGPGLGLAGLALERVEHLADRQNAVLMPELHRVGHVVLGNLARADFDHVDRVAVAGHDEVDVGIFHLSAGRVDDELAIDAPDANAGERPVKRDLAQRHGGRGGQHADDVGLGLQVAGEDHDLDLDLVAEAFGEERAHGPVDHAAGEDFARGGAALAFEESAGELAGGGVFLAVIDRQREEVDSLARRAGHDGAEDDGFAVADERRAGGLPGDLARFDGEDVGADLALDFHDGGLGLTHSQLYLSDCVRSALCSSFVRGGAARAVRVKRAGSGGLRRRARRRAAPGLETRAPRPRCPKHHARWLPMPHFCEGCVMRCPRRRPDPARRGRQCHGEAKCGSITCAGRAC